MKILTANGPLDVNKALIEFDITKPIPDLLAGLDYVTHPALTKKEKRALARAYAETTYRPGTGLHKYCRHVDRLATALLKLNITLPPCADGNDYSDGQRDMLKYLIANPGTDLQQLLDTL